MQEQNATDLAAWEQPSDVSEVTLQMMDETIQQMINKKHEYEEQDKILKALGAEWDALEQKVIQLLTASNKKSYKLDGVANVSMSMRTSYKVPSTPENKVKLFDYIERNHGREALLQLQGINSNTLNAWAKKEFESGVMSIDGLDQPTITPRLSVTKG